MGTTGGLVEIMGLHRNIPAETDMEAVKRVARVLLHTPIHETTVPLIVNHPFFLTAIQPVRNEMTGEYDTINILDDIKGRKRVYDYISQQIEETENIAQIGFTLIDKKYRLLFLKMVEPFCSSEDIGTYISSLWVSVECISQDPNVSHRDIIRMFNRSSKATLMTDGERNALDVMPDVISIYRGVRLPEGTISSKGDHGFSWTLDRDIANWYCHRYGNMNRQTEKLYQAQIRKEDILAYFGERAGEKEIVVNPKKLINVIEIEPDEVKA